MLVPRKEKCSIAFAVNLFLIEKLVNLEAINISALIFEHMHRVMMWKKAKHGIPYGYLLNFVFNHFEVPLGVGVPSTTKHMFTKDTLLEYECAEGQIPGCSQVAVILEQQATLKCEVDDIINILNAKEVEIATLKFKLQKVISSRPNTSQDSEEVLRKLRAENELLQAKKCLA